MDSRTHWEKIYGEKAPNAVSWYRPHLETSLSLIERVASRDSAIIDVGGGESTLVDDLLSHGHENVTVLDVSQTAIEANRTEDPANRRVNGGGVVSIVLQLFRWNGISLSPQELSQGK